MAGVYATKKEATGGMNKREKEILLHYLANELIRLENDLTDCQNHMRWRNPDEVDCIETAIAISRLNVFKEFQRAVLAILSLNDDGKD